MRQHRAERIVDGLLKTGRASKPRLSQGYILLDTKGETGFYWVPYDGQRILKGTQRAQADELQAGFVDAMARAGQAA